MRWRNGCLAFRLSSLFGVLTVVCILCVYVTSYLALLSPIIYTTESAGGVAVGFRKANYRPGGQFAVGFFAPTHHIDRQIRRRYWNAYSSLDDDVRYEDRPWGTIRYVNGELADVSVYANDRGDVVGLDELRKFSTLGHVRVVGEAFHDSDLLTLQQLKSLAVLELLQTKVTRFGVQRIREAMPNCHVECISVGDNGIEI